MFGPPGNEPAEQLEFGYCFDVSRYDCSLKLKGEMLTCAEQVSIRAFLPVWVFLYVVQFLLMPVIARDYWVSLFFGNLLYLVAFGYYFVITFLGYNGMSSRLSHLCLFHDMNADMYTQHCPSSTIPISSSPQSQY